MNVRSCIYCDSNDYQYDHMESDTGTVVYMCQDCGKKLWPEDFNYSDNEIDTEEVDLSFLDEEVEYEIELPEALR